MILSQAIMEIEPADYNKYIPFLNYKLYEVVKNPVSYAGYRLIGRCSSSPIPVFSDDDRAWADDAILHFIDIDKILNMPVWRGPDIEADNTFFDKLAETETQYIQSTSHDRISMRQLPFMCLGVVVDQKTDRLIVGKRVKDERKIVFNGFVSDFRNLQKKENEKIDKLNSKAENMIEQFKSKFCTKFIEIMQARYFSDAVPCMDDIENKQWRVRIAKEAEKAINNEV
jgi:hypothetical protein